MLLDEIKHYSRQSTKMIEAFTHPAVLWYGAWGISGWKKPIEIRIKHVLCTGGHISDRPGAWCLYGIHFHTMPGRVCCACKGWTLHEHTQHDQSTNALQRDKPRLGVQRDRSVGVGLASLIIPSHWWSYGGIYFQSMQNKWGSFICHMILGYKKQNKGRNFVMLRNIPVSLKTKYPLSSVTIKQMPGKYRKQSITAPGLLKKPHWEECSYGLDWSQYEVFRGPSENSPKVNPV